MKKYYRVMLGRGSKHASKCFEGAFIGVDYGIHQDLTGKLSEEWREFNREFIPVYLENRPHKSKIAAGLACGTLWTVSKGIKKGDIVFCPDGEGYYLVGEINGDYIYQEGGVLPHRRPVQWFKHSIDREDMSEMLKNSTGSPGAAINITKYQEEIENLIAGFSAAQLISRDQTVQDPFAFAMEKHLEEFLVKNWSQTELAQKYDIYEEDEYHGQQYPTDTGQMDILAISKDKQTLLVIELKRGRASDVVVGQILRYMGYVQEELTEENQTVKGVIIAMEDDLNIQRALTMVPEIEFYCYQINFKLSKVYS